MDRRELALRHASRLNRQAMDGSLTSMSDEPRRWIIGAARLGHVATGFVYVLVGIIAIASAFDRRTPAMEAQGALETVLTAGVLGHALLLAIAASLTADFAWQIVRASTNADLAPANVVGVANRTGWVLSGAIHFGLAVTAVKLAFAVPQHSAEYQAKASAAAVMLVPVGRWALTATRYRDRPRWVTVRVSRVAR